MATLSSEYYKPLSCSGCRQQKIRCIALPNQRACQRCLKRGLQCTRPTSRRMPGSLALSDRVKKRKGGREVSTTTSPSTEVNDLSEPNGESPLNFFGRSDSPNAIHGSGPGLPNILNPVRLLANTGVQQSANLQHRQIVTSAISGPSQRDHIGKNKRDAIHYESRCEPLSLVDPIGNQLISLTDAQESFTFFLTEINPIITILDPYLHTFEYVSQHGTLLTAICLVATWHTASHASSGKAQRLQRHLLQKCRPAILLEGYCSTEIIAAFTLYVSFQPCTDDYVADRSWSMMGDSIKLATELDLHSKVVSKHLGVADEMEQRHARAKERMWINIWLSAQSLANQTGRRPFLLSEGTIDDCSDWHLSPYKVHGDIILVAQLTLRRLLKELQELVTRLTRNFHHSSLHTGEIKYCLHRIQWEVDQWQITWARSEPTSPRSAKLKLHENHVKILLYSRVLQACPGTVAALDLPLSFLYESVIGYLQSLVDPEKEGIVLFGQKGVYLHGAYICCFAFKLINVANHFAWIARNELIELVQKVARLFDRAGNQCSSSYNTPRIYGKYLQLLLPTAMKSTSSSSLSGVEDRSTENRGNFTSSNGFEVDPKHSTSSLLDSYQRFAGEDQFGAATVQFDDGSIQAARDFEKWFDDALFGLEEPSLITGP